MNWRDAARRDFGPSWRRIGPGGYESPDGRFRIERAWNSGPRGGDIAVWNLLLMGDGGYVLGTLEGFTTIREAKGYAREEYFR